MSNIKKLFPLVLVLGLTGCGDSGSNPDFLIMNKTEGTAQITYQVQVPAGASMSDEAEWARVRGDTYNKVGKQVVANFYEGTVSAENLKTQCDGNGQCTQY